MAEVNTYKRSLGLFELVSLGVGGTIGSGYIRVPWYSYQPQWSMVALCMGNCCRIRIMCSSFSSDVSGLRHPIVFILFSGRNLVPYRTVPHSPVSHFFRIWHFYHSGRYRAVYIIFRYFQRAAYGEYCHRGLLLANIRGISFSGTTENILTTLKIIPLVIIALLLIPSINTHNFEPSDHVQCTGFLATNHCIWPYRF